jgi:hypothetical protein
MSTVGSVAADAGQGLSLRMNQGTQVPGRSFSEPAETPAQEAVARPRLLSLYCIQRMAYSLAVIDGLVETRMKMDREEKLPAGDREQYILPGKKLIGFPGKIYDMLCLFAS